MIVHNLSDVETPKLKQFGLSQCSFVVAGTMLSPGASVSVESEEELAHLEHLCSVGALCVGDPPESYKKKPSTPEAKPALVYTDAPKADPGPDSKKKSSRE